LAPERIEIGRPIMSGAGAIGKGPASDHASALALAQGLFYTSTGLWAIVDDRSFQAVTGPKVDVWLVKTVGTLVSVVGGVLGLAGARRRVTPELALLGAGCALGLAAIDIIYVARGRISRVYLGDAAVELAIAAAWAGAGASGRGLDGREVGPP
jgi:hypothetical protein